MKAIHAGFLFSLVSTAFTQASPQCQGDPYTVITKDQWNTFTASLNKTGIDSPRNIAKKASRPSFTKLPRRGAQNFQDYSHPASIKEAPLGVSDKIQQGYCNFVTNCQEAKNPSGRPEFLNAFKRLMDPSQMLGDVNSRRDAVSQLILNMTDSGALIFDNSNLKAQPALPRTISVNIHTQWRDHRSPLVRSGQPFPEFVQILYGEGRLTVQPQASDLIYARSLGGRRVSKAGFAHLNNNPKGDIAAKHSLHTLTDRDDALDYFCFPYSRKEWSTILRLLWETVVLPNMISQSQDSVEISMVHPGAVGTTDIFEGGQVRTRFWLTEVPDVVPLVQDLPMAATSTSGQSNGAHGMTCFEQYIPVGADATNPGPSKKFWNTLSSQCKLAFYGPSFSSDAGEEVKDFHLYGNSTFEGDATYGASWSADYQTLGCTDKLKCSDLFGHSGDAHDGDAWNNVRTCKPSMPDNTYHGGIIYHFEALIGFCGALRVWPNGPNSTSPG